VQQALQLLTQGQGGDQETYPDEKRKIAGRQVLLTEVGACAHWSRPEVVHQPR
jgi:hypothetical protein